MRLLLYACFGVLTSTTMNNFIIQADLLPQQVDYQTTLRFLLLGDWGKGGNGGGYTTSHMSDNNKTFDDDHDEGFLYNSTSISSIKSLMAESRGLKNNKQTYQAAVASAMGSYSESFQPSFVIALGDNFYSNGVSSSTDAYWDYLWTNVYLDYYKDLRIPWYPVFGKPPINHCPKSKIFDASATNNYYTFM